MTLTLNEAATALGWTPRQLRYSIRTGKLVAQKTEGRWVVDAASLPLDGRRAHARTAAVEATRAAADAALAPRAGALRFSVTGVGAFRQGVALARALPASGARTLLGVLPGARPGQ